MCPLFGTEDEERLFYPLVLRPDINPLWVFSGLGELEPFCIWAGGGGRLFSTTPASSVSPGSIRDWDTVPDTIPTALGINDLSLNNSAVINTEQ